jgi:hypothetical protein
MVVKGALTDAYLHTTYRVLAAQTCIDIRVGERSGALEQLLQSSGVRQWAFMTASNPKSRKLPDTENARRNEAMKAMIEQSGWRWLDAIGVPDRPDWQPEHSVLVLGIDRNSALELAKKWDQLAIVCGMQGEPAQLVWTD